MTREREAGASAGRRQRQADWLSVEQALAVVIAQLTPLESEPVALLDAVGRTLAETITAPHDHPPWDNSGMDGYAVHAADVRGASRTQPVRLRVAGSIAAGEVRDAPVERGTAVRIMTGAPVPAGADSVIRSEHVDPEQDGVIAVFDDADAGRNIRPLGEDLRAGQRALAPGRVLRAAGIGLLATMGVQRVRVTRAPRVAVLSTGDELLPVEQVDALPARNGIIDANSPALHAALRSSGCAPALLGIARDDAASLRTAISHGLAADLLITTAGASVGEHDLVKDVLESLGVRVLFWRVRIRPGSPTSFGILERSDGSRLGVFGLPGNPVSVLVTYEILVRPALRRLLGQDALYPWVIAAEAAEEIRSRPGLRRFLRVRLDHEDGRWRARSTGPQGSGVLSSMAAADALLIVPETTEVIAAGEPVRVVPLYAGDAASAHCLL